MELFLAFGAGLISFLSPCVLPLIPGYISYISNTSFNEMIEKKNINLFPLVLFTLGFSIVFIIFGAASTFLGQILLQNSIELRIFAGLVIIIFSLQILGLINLKFLNYEKRIQTNNNKYFYSPLIIGMAFAFGWTPCIGPILGSILVLASTEENINKGIMLLSVYSLGLAIPFIFSGYLIQKFLIFSKNFRKNINIVSKLGGGILLIDYGYTKAQGNDTLQSIKSHKKNIFYKNIGEADITYLVNFQLLNKFLLNKKLFLNNLVSQNFFLRKLGIIERAEILSKKLSFKEKSDIYYRLERLLSEKKMGGLFKVLFAANNKTRFNLGFK